LQIVGGWLTEAAETGRRNPPTVASLGEFTVMGSSQGQAERAPELRDDKRIRGDALSGSLRSIAAPPDVVDANRPRWRREWAGYARDSAQSDTADYLDPTATEVGLLGSEVRPPDWNTV
jgi:hypothetical protein